MTSELHTLSSISISIPGPNPATSRPARWPLLRRWARSKAAVAALCFIIFIVLIAILAPVLAPRDPNAQVLRDRLLSPSSKHLLGTDQYGRDQLSRLLFGARVSLIAAVEAVTIGVVMGVPLGLLAGYRGGWLDAAFSRTNDALMSVPALLFALTIISALGPGLTNAMFAVGVVFIPIFYRTARAAAINVRRELYVEASEAIGCSDTRTLFRHVLPNSAAGIIVQMSLLLGAAVSAEASLSFLGLGVEPPTASWGSMVAGGVPFRTEQKLLILAPGALIMLTVLAFMLIGEGLRQALAGDHETTATRGEQ